MSKQISKDGIETIVKMLDVWDTKLTWDLLLDAVEKRLRVRYTRQALSNYDRISRAFSDKKASLRDTAGSSPHKSLPPELQKAYERIEALSAENSRLKKESDALLEQFTRWAYNAHSRGLDEKFLNKPLPPINRGKTEEQNVSGNRKRTH